LWEEAEADMHPTEPVAHMEVKEEEPTVKRAVYGAVEILVMEVHRTPVGGVVKEELMPVATAPMERWEWVVTEQMPAGTRAAAAEAAAIMEAEAALTAAAERPVVEAPVI